MREVVITNCEKRFLGRCLAEHRRLDDRAFDEFRPLTIQFGKDWGSCLVSLGSTRVLAQTSCEIQQPKSSRPSEGILNINLELNPIAAPNFEAGRQSDTAVELNRLLEKCVKDSKAIDLESLCIKTSEKVWALRTDLNVLNHEGNILDCASVALLASLAHFKRPDVTCEGEEFIIHSHKQRDPIPTVIHHYPVCLTYTIFNGGEFILSDPSLIEEGIADAVLTIGLNGFKELCSLHLGGKAELLPNTILSVVGKASNRAKIVIEDIKRALREDEEYRKTKIPIGFFDLKMDTLSLVDLEQSLDQWQDNKTKKQRERKEKREPKQEIVVVQKEEPEVKEVLYEADVVDVKSYEEDDEVIYVEPPKAQRVTINIRDSDSEEEDVVMLTSNFSK